MNSLLWFFTSTFRWCWFLFFILLYCVGGTFFAAVFLCRKNCFYCTDATIFWCNFFTLNRQLQQIKIIWSNLRYCLLRLLLLYFIWCQCLLRFVVSVCCCCCCWCSMSDHKRENKTIEQKKLAEKQTNYNNALSTLLFFIFLFLFRVNWKSFVMFGQLFLVYLVSVSYNFVFCSIINAGKNNTKKVKKDAGTIEKEKGYL